MNHEHVDGFAIGDALRFGWRTTISNAGPLLIMGAVATLLALLNQSLMTPEPTLGLRSLLGVVVRLLQTAVAMVYLRAGLRLHDGEAIDLTRPRELLSGFVPYLLTSILYGLIVVGGLVLLIVPGVIWALKFGFAGFAVVDERHDTIDALKRSSRLTDGVKGRLLAFALLMAGVNFLGALAFGIGLLLTFPTTVIASAYVFRRLQARDAVRSSYAPQAPAIYPQTPSPSH